MVSGAEFLTRIGKAGDRQKVELYRRFFPEASEFEAQAFVDTYCSAETMAEFQGLLLGLEQRQDGWTGVSTNAEHLVATE